MSTLPRIKASLLEAHRKLSDYYYKYDQSPFYTWAACMFSDLHLSRYQKPSHNVFPVLDPRISYKGALQGYAGDPDLLAYLESTKDLLHTHFEKYYAIYTHSLNKTVNTINGTADDSPSKVNFTSRYKRKD